jgi:hypothetical protein
MLQCGHARSTLRIVYPLTAALPCSARRSEYMRAARIVDPSQSADKNNELCYTDIPGEYNNVAFQSKGQRFQVRIPISLP